MAVDKCDSAIGPIWTVNDKSQSHCDTKGQSNNYLDQFSISPCDKKNWWNMGPTHRVYWWVMALARPLILMYVSKSSVLKPFSVLAFKVKQSDTVSLRAYSHTARRTYVEVLSFDVRRTSTYVKAVVVRGIDYWPTSTTVTVRHCTRKLYRPLCKYPNKIKDGWWRSRSH